MTPKKAGLTFDRICGGLFVLAGGIVIFDTVLINSDVLMRYLVHSPQPYAQELIEWSLVYITFFCTAWVLIRERHVRVDILISRLHPRWQRILSIIGSFLSAGVCLVIALFGSWLVWDLTKRNIHEATVLSPPKWVTLWVIPAGFFMLFIQFLRQAVKNWKGPSIEQ